jgi:hypothetical protein
MFEAVKKILGDLGIETQALQISVTDVVAKMKADEPSTKGFDFPMDDLDAMKAGYFQGLKSGILRIFLNKDFNKAKSEPQSKCFYGTPGCLAGPWGQHIQSCSRGWHR